MDASCCCKPYSRPHRCIVISVQHLLVAGVCSTNEATDRAGHGTADVHALSGVFCNLVGLDGSS
jgi:hypothetical protein